MLLPSSSSSQQCHTIHSHKIPSVLIFLPWKENYLKGMGLNLISLSFARISLCCFLQGKDRNREDRKMCGFQPPRWSFGAETAWDNVNTLKLSVRTQWLVGKAQWELRPACSFLLSSCLTEGLFSTQFFRPPVSLLAYFKKVLYSNVKGRHWLQSFFLQRLQCPSDWQPSAVQFLKPAA